MQNELQINKFQEKGLTLQESLTTVCKTGRKVGFVQLCPEESGNLAVLPQLRTNQPKLVHPQPESLPGSFESSTCLLH